MDDFKETRGYCELKEAPDRICGKFALEDAMLLS